MTILFLLLQKIYETSIFRAIIQGIWAIVNIIKLFIFCVFNKKFIYHYGIFGKYGNVGDNILYEQIEKLFDIYFNSNKTWYNRLAVGEITSPEVLLINKYCSMIIVGGHGLIMPESNKNNNSGWGFNIKIKNLKKINIPIIFFSIGYNVFRSNNKFIPVFKEHIEECVRKSLFFGLRNYGSINEVKKYLPENLQKKIKYQPCPTTVIGLFERETIEVPFEKTNKIAIVTAFNKIKYRYNDNIKIILEQLVNYAKYMQEKGFDVNFFGHHLFDTYGKHIKYFKRHGFRILHLYKYTKNNIYKLYKQNKLVVSMRGHGLMIPFGLSLPTISLTTQDKQKYFLETIDHADWSIDANNNFYTELVQKTFEIINNYGDILQDLVLKRENNKKTTEINMEFIVSNCK
jgi:hypothetical protein